MQHRKEHLQKRFAWNQWRWMVSLVLFSFTVMTGCRNAVHEDTGVSPTRSAQEQLATFVLDPELSIQLVASEPMVQEPVVITFDEKGRLWVVEMRGFMPDVDGTDENAPVGRISILDDLTGDGAMDTSWVYLDSLIMPRALAIVSGGALVVENQALWLTQDTDGDLRADVKTLIDPDYAGSPLPEHAGNGLWRGMDNWYYNAKSSFRYRLVGGAWLRDSTEFRGQWGICHDDKGRLFYNYNWSQLHADLVPPNTLTRNRNHTPTTGIDHGLTIDRRVYPVRANPAVNRGYIAGTLDNKGRLLEFTAACSPFVYRGDALPQQFYGNAFVCEPAGNLVKRNVIEDDGVMLTAHDPHPGREFLASTDERFRPVYITSGPDGALYIADMYRGVIQHAAYVTPYLREQTHARQLDKPIHGGRIWRIVAKGSKKLKSPKDVAGSADDWIKALESANGWTRDMAQRQLVERRDQTVGESVKDIVFKSDNQYARLHALWVLEGLNLLQPEILLPLLQDKEPMLQVTALRLLEPFMKNDKAVHDQVGAWMMDEGTSGSLALATQVSLSAHALSTRACLAVLQAIAKRHGDVALIRDALLSSLADREATFMEAALDEASWAQPSPSVEILLEMLTAAVLRKGDAVPIERLLTMLTRARTNDWREKCIVASLCLQGSAMEGKPIPLRAKPALLEEAALLSDTQRQMLSGIFAWPGHQPAPPVRESHTGLDEQNLALFTLGRKHYLTACAGCHGTDGGGMRRFAPPLAGSEWVVEDEKRLALIVLHGIEGPIEVGGEKYGAPDILPVMPAHSTLDDGEITAILTYIRNAWGNEGGPLSKGLVGSTRHTTQGRVVPWTADELNDHIKALRAPVGKLARDQ